jgi:hypothetical protein
MSAPDEEVEVLVASLSHRARTSTRGASVAVERNPGGVARSFFVDHAAGQAVRQQLISTSSVD